MCGIDKTSKEDEQILRDLVEGKAESIVENKKREREQEQPEEEEQQPEEEEQEQPKENKKIKIIDLTKD